MRGCCTRSLGFLPVGALSRFSLLCLPLFAFFSFTFPRNGAQSYRSNSCETAASHAHTHGCGSVMVFIWKTALFKNLQQKEMRHRNGDGRTNTQVPVAQVWSQPHTYTSSCIAISLPLLLVSWKNLFLVMCTALSFIKLLNENMKWLSLISSSKIITVEQYPRQRTYWI